MKSETPRKAAPPAKAGNKAISPKRDTGASVTVVPEPVAVAAPKRAKAKAVKVVKTAPEPPASAPVASTVATVKTAPIVKLPLAATKLAPTHEEIAKRAYEIYLARGQAEGNAAQDWLQAEQELLARQNN